MTHLNVEIKARCADLARARELLRERGATSPGTDEQTDTYYGCREGRLKLRQGTIENSLIHYARADQAGPKESRVTLFPTTEGERLGQLLTRALGVLVVVRKRREIYFLANVKIHLDAVDGLGTFLEIEAIDADGTIGRERLQAQCRELMQVLGVDDEDLVTCSYSDLLLRPR